MTTTTTTTKTKGTTKERQHNTTSRMTSNEGVRFIIVPARAFCQPLRLGFQVASASVHGGCICGSQKARRRPKPNHGRNGGNQARRCDRQDVHDGQRKDDGGRFGKEFWSFIFLRILLVRVVLVVAFNVMTDAPALRMRRRRRSRRDGLVVGVGISLASAHYGIPRFVCKNVRKTKKQKREREKKRG
jgi:hypothetical protein